MTLALVELTDDRLEPLERLEALCDPGSLQLLRSAVRSRRLGPSGVPGDGVVAATGTVGSRPVACYAHDRSFAGGSLGAAGADSVVAALRLAGRAGIPIVGFVESAGARLQEGLDALAGYGRIFREHVALSGHVPQISVVCGTAAGGGCYGPALTDFVVMTRRAAMFLTGPAVVHEVTGEDVDAAALGGARVHERNGVCQLVAESELDACLTVRELLEHLPAHAGEPPPRRAPEPPLGGPPDGAVPAAPRQVYDVRDVARTLVDGGGLLEISPRWARNVVCALARLDGRAVGVVANQPRHLGGVLDADAAQKAARFVRTCNAFGLPLIVLVDTPGFLPGTGQERAAVIRHGAKLVHAFAEASVPRLTVVLRKAFGGAFIAMNSRDLGADLVLAWPDAELGVMAARQAVGIVSRRQIAAAPEPARARDALASDYAREHLGAAAAAAAGHVDEVIAPRRTRARLVAVLSALALVPPSPDRVRNIPL